jgi:hypothetical protein
VAARERGPFGIVLGRRPDRAGSAGRTPGTTGRCYLAFRSLSFRGQGLANGANRIACAGRPRPGGRHRIADEAWMEEEEEAAGSGLAVGYNPPEGFEIEIEVDVVGDISI